MKIPTKVGHGHNDRRKEKTMDFGIKKLSQMTDEEFEYWTEHTENQRLLEELEAPTEPDEQLTRPDYGQRFYREPLWSEILPGLWQGGTADDDAGGRWRSKPAITLKDFDTCITMYAYANPADWHIREIRYGIYDSNMDDFDAEELFDIIRIAHSDWKKGKRILSRCQAGWNRSGLITALILIRDGMSAEDAIALIQKKRSPNALCNGTFRKWLMEQDPKAWQGETYGTAKPKRNTPKKK